MGVVIKQSFWGTVIAYLGVIIGYVNMLYFRAEYFDLAQIGLFTLITANAMIVSPISSFGMGSSFIKYFPAFKEENKNRFFTFLFLVTLLGNACILSIGFLLKDVIASRYVETAPTYIDFLAITAIIIVTNSFFDLFFNYCLTTMKVIFPSFLRDIYLRTTSLLLVFGYAMDWWSFESSVKGLGLTYLLAFIFLFFHLFFFHGFRFDFHFSIITREWKVKFFKFGTYSMLMAGSFAILNNASYDQITTTLGPDMTGIFTTCFFIAMIVEMPRRNMTKVIAPIISAKIMSRNMHEVERLYKRGSIIMSVIGLLLFIGIATNLNDLFDFIPKGAAFQAGFWVVIGVCFSKLSSMICSFSGEIINFSPLYRFNLFFQVIAAITLLVLNYFFISIWGLNGAVVSYLIANLCQLLLQVSFIRYHFGIHPFAKSHLPLLTIGVVVTLIACFFQAGMHPVINIAIRSILTGLIFVFLIYRFRISADINKIIHSTFERYLKINLPK